MTAPHRILLRASCVSVLLSMCLAASAHANMANPYVPGTPGTALYGPSTAVVLDEELRFVYVSNTRCEVTATYRIESAQAQPTIALRFFVPRLHNRNIKSADARVNGKFMDIAQRAATEEDLKATPAPDKTGMLQYSIPSENLGILSFPAALKKGTNTISVRYAANIGYRIRGFYPLSQSFHPLIAYEAWPLRSWTLAPGFQFDVVVELARGATLPERIFGLPDVDLDPGGDLDGQEGKGRMVYRHRYGRDFPDRFDLTIESGTFPD